MPRFAPPGVRFLINIFIRLTIYLSILFLGLRVVASALEIHIPIWALVFGLPLVLPFVITLRGSTFGRLLYWAVLWRDLKHKRAAHALGARMPPTLNTGKVANYDFLATQMHNFTHGYPSDGLDELANELGPMFNIRVLWTNTLFTTCPEHLKLILATDFGNYEKGDGVFNSDGAFHRGLTRPHFNREKITDFHLFDRHANTAIQLIKERCSAGFAVDFQDVLHRFTMDTATEFLLGHCVYTLTAGLPYPHGIDAPPSNHTKTAQFAIVARERRGPIWPLFEMFVDATAKPMKVVNAFIEPLVASAVERQRQLLDHLVKSTSDLKMLRDETLNILVAGRDTTASTLTFIVHFLAKYPEVMRRLRCEVLEKVGPSRLPTFEDIKDMPYLRAVCNENTPLVVPFNVRSSGEARVWPSPDPNEKPIYIPAGVETCYSVFMMHRRKDLWGPDAEEFDPDRFLDGRLPKYLLKNNFIFLPFNAGPRICLGQQFAYNEMSYFLIKLLQHFSSFELRPNAGPPHSRPPKEWSNASGRKESINSDLKVI
ncbi:cytochrome P450 monooxygenase pc-1 [Flagelloscypha sp. PMI_526]|nr:cytochrome P450 monooxygenase pc-1 [Flagelloscypha sp. PMI_526]